VKSKKKAPEQSPVAQLTDRQIQKLADRLRGTGSNVFYVAGILFGVREYGDEIFERLEEDGNLFKCEGCSTWKSMDQEESATRHCVACYAAQNE
jgi:hypothetical protein